MSRLPTLAAILVLQTTSISVFLLTLGFQPIPWLALLLVVLAGIVTDAQMNRFPEERQRLWLLAAAFLAAMCAVALRVGGLAAAVTALMPGTGSQLFAAAYGTLLIALFAFWCGTRIASHSPTSIAQAFSLGVFAAIIGLLIAPLIGSLYDPDRVRRITLHLLALVGSGLLAQALIRAEEENDGVERRWSWRWIATFGLAIGLVSLLGLGASGLFGGPAAALLELLWGGVVIILTIVMLPILIVLGWLVDMIIRMVGMPTGGRAPRGIPTMPAFSENAQSLFPNASVWAFNTIAVTAVLLPLVILVLVILFARRRRKLAAADEERESLLSWRTVANDFGGMFRGWHPFARHLEGLRAVLANLRGNDSASRIRRVYVRLLLALEERERPRPSSSTPSEFAPTARDSFPTAAPAVATLTHAYERARYAPQVSDEDAAAAERAWREVEGDTS